jgi:hypothetical protein
MPQTQSPRKYSSRSSSTPRGSAPAAGEKPESEILFQKYFKSVGPRTYAAQLKKAGNGNHFLVLTEGKRDDKTGELRKVRLFLFSEDFVPFFKMLHETAQFIREHPLPEEIRQKRERYWAKQNGAQKSPAASDRGPKTNPYSGNQDRSPKRIQSPRAPQMNTDGHR